MVLKNFSQCHSTIEFRRQVPKNKYTKLKKTSTRLISVFCTTYSYEFFFSVMKFVKSKHLATLANEPLKELIRSASITYRPNFQRLASQVQD